MKVENVARQFVEAINQRDADAVAELMTEDHLFTDGMGETVTGRERMRAGWVGYFTIVPDFLIEVSELFVSGNTVMLLGRASGTYSTGGPLKKENHWSTPAAWRAVIDGDKVARWQVYADNEPIRQVMRREQALKDA